MRRTIPAAALFLVTVGAALHAADNWPQWRGPEAGPTFVPVAQNELNDYCLSSIAVSEGQIFLRTSKHLWVIGNRRK